MLEKPTSPRQDLVIVPTLSGHGRDKMNDISRLKVGGEDGKVESAGDPKTERDAEPGLGIFILWILYRRLDLPTFNSTTLSALEYITNTSLLVSPQR